ncbi:unnamed protein product [Phaedon cochleariae]|uniref:Annexin n=1 Tax=Phaedon cochleariae TaxID=80249 RepID=A0A9N9SD53_PHACE|nr:unnamed protein product [Phaedon cochleariae]
MSNPADHPGEQRTPTVVPAQTYDPSVDAEAIKVAMESWLINDVAITRVLSLRSREQRFHVAVQFRTLYGKDMVERFQKKLHGNFKKSVLAMMTPLPDFYAKELRNAVTGVSTDEDTLLEVLCTKSNQEILAIRQAYHALFYSNLENDIKGDTSGVFKRLMVSLCRACRDEDSPANQEEAIGDAQTLFDAGEERIGTDESTFIRILTHRSFAQVQLILREYERISGHDIEQAIKNEFSGDSQRGFLALVQSIKNQPLFFAKMLNKSMRGLGTDNRQLIRLMTTRCEIDLGDIAREYEAEYGEPLLDAIARNCSGDYRRCMEALIRGPY